MKKVIVVGAGAAGNFVSSAIKRNRPDLDVTLIYDPKTPAIGVGESLQFNSSSFMSNILGFKKDIEWLKKSRSIFKLGTIFQGWDNTDTPFYTNHTDIPNMNVLAEFKANGIHNVTQSKAEQEYHPHDMLDVWLYLQKNGLLDQLEHRTYRDLYAGHTSPTIWYSYLNRIPYNLTNGTWEMPRGIFGYHINAMRIGSTVHELVGKPAGVKELPIAIKDVVLTGDGSIDHLLLDDDTRVSADLYFDCTGFARVLCKKMEFNFIKLDDSFNDSCIVGPHKYTDDNERTNNVNIRAMDNGWHFSVGMDVRSGEGYVFNSKYVTDTDKLVNEYYNTTGKTDVNFRLIKWDPGYYSEAFVKNCVAIGLSHGLTDAYDGNAFSTVLGKIEKIIGHLKEDLNLDFTWRDEFNRYTNMRMDETILRIKFAFHLCKKDSPYWDIIRDVGRKQHTLELLYEKINDPMRRTFADKKNRKFLWSRGVWVSQAIYYDIPVTGLLDALDKETEKLAIDYFNSMYNKNQAAGLKGIPVVDFYKMLYPLDK